MIQVNDRVQDVLKDREHFKQQQKSYYEVLLQNIYLPSLNVWKNPYTKNFDIRYLGQKYLEADKFQDLYLIQYWSDFIKHVSDDADYNAIENITILLTIVNAGVNNAFEGRETEAAMQAIDILVNRETGESTFEPLRTIDKSADDNAKSLTIQAKKTCNR